MDNESNEEKSSKTRSTNQWLNCGPKKETSPILDVTEDPISDEAAGAEQDQRQCRVKVPVAHQLPLAEQEICINFHKFPFNEPPTTRTSSAGSTSAVSAFSGSYRVLWATADYRGENKTETGVSFVGFGPPLFLVGSSSLAYCFRLWI